VSVRAFVRGPDGAAEKLGDGVELAAGDFSDTVSLRRALEGMDNLFLTSADGPQEVEHETAVIDAAARLPRIVKLSMVGSPLPRSIGTAGSSSTCGNRRCPLSSCDPASTCRTSLGRRRLSGTSRPPTEPGSR
jgi:hypothetical protein